MIWLIFIILAAILDSQRDKIRNKPDKTWFPNLPFWVQLNHNENSDSRKWMKWIYDSPLSIINCGWHLCKSLSLICLFICFALYEPLMQSGGLLMEVIVLYIIYGTVFNLSYSTKI